ncbi:Deleted in malignant brain tumors 1 protein [Acropora cervicornis]|uniref:Deleted in malignant brain tumors 1 protein n=1 Tax=Acropora cervicornis TaxID=6130 RepID=A0AAD9URB7_ACRCE|nr:Deleted in malignant brain tumors 1 protein [Acropora cervicornis]
MAAGQNCQCQYTTFSRRFPTSLTPVRVFASVNHGGNSSQVHDTVLIWVEDISTSSFKTCVVTGGQGIGANCTIDWLAFQGAQSGTFPTVPYIQTTVQHGTLDQLNDAMDVWIESISTTEFEVCLRESRTFSGPHSSLYVIVNFTEPFYVSPKIWTSVKLVPSHVMHVLFVLTSLDHTTAGVDPVTLATARLSVKSSMGTSYSSNVNCGWTITSNAKLELAFVEPFQTERNFDFVYVYDGNSSSARLIGRFSGSSRPGTIESSSNQLHVRFTSDRSSQYYGLKAVYRVLNQGSVRLMGGSLYYGRVEIFYNDQWGTVCDDAWDLNDAYVVCRQLGFPRLASSAYTGATYGQGTGPIWMDDVACSGSESHLYDCRHRGWGTHNCNHAEDSSVVCRYGSSNLRLASGGYYYGRVEVYYSGRWGTVCDDYWDINDAHVVCRQLGFSRATHQYHSAYYGQGSGRIWLDDVTCHGGEASLSSCSHRGWGSHNCGHGEDATFFNDGKK